MIERFLQMRRHLEQELSKAHDKRVAALVRERYSIDEEIALINNYNAYLIDNRITRYKEEYEQYQQYRAQCKAQGGTK